MANPTIQELQNTDEYELVHELEHNHVKDFVVSQITSGSKLIQGYMIYQLVLILFGLFFATRPLVLAMRGNLIPMFYLLIAILFSFSLLILIHELFHALAFKITGAPKVSIGAYLKKFIFYAEADRHVVNSNQFKFVALAPLVMVKIITLAGILFTAGTPSVYFWIFIMCAHSLFCAGDIGMIDYINKFSDTQLFTFDVKDEKKSYFYCRK